MRPPRSHRAIYLLFVHRNANLSIYPVLPAFPLRSLRSSHQRYLALLLTVVTIVLFLHRIHTSRYAFVFGIPCPSGCVMTLWQI